jgi:hypothetical protein
MANQAILNIWILFFNGMGDILKFIKCIVPVCKRKEPAPYCDTGEMRKKSRRGAAGSDRRLLIANRYTEEEVSTNSPNQ